MRRCRRCVRLVSFELFRRHVRQRSDNGPAVSLLGDEIVADDKLDPAGARSRARPKSSSLAPLGVSMTLAGFRSRCTMPCAMRQASASAISTAVRRACVSGIGPLRSRRQRFTFRYKT